MLPHFIRRMRGNARLPGARLVRRGIRQAARGDTEKAVFHGTDDVRVDFQFRLRMATRLGTGSDLV